MMLFDAYGRQIVFEALREEQAAPTLVGIRNIYSIIDDSIGLTPEKAVGILRTAEYGDPWLYLELAERMEEKDLLYQGVLHTRKMAVSQLDIDVTAAGDDSQSLDDAEFVRDILIDSNQIDLHDVIFEMLDSLGKGFSATEIIWDTDGRYSGGTGSSLSPLWLPFALKWRDPRWFMFDWVSGEQLLVRTLSTEGPQLPVGRDTWDSRLSPINFRVRIGGLLGHEVGIQPATQPLAPFKFITHVTRAKAGLPIRGGLARVAIWCYLFKNYVLKDWMVFAEVYGQPMRLGKYGPGATENDKTALLRAVANIGTDAAAIIPESMAIEFVESKGGGQKSHEMYQKFCEYLDKLLTIGVLGQELTTQLPRGAGSRAAAEVHDVVRRDIATDDSRRVAATLNRDLVKPLIDLNRGPRRRYPRISIGFNERADLTELMAGLGPAIDRGLRVSEKWLRDQFGAPAPMPGEALLHSAEPSSAIMQSAQPERKRPSWQDEQG
jgi:phage gp29-like protein